MQKIHEALTQAIEVAFVRAEVIVVDIGDHRDQRLQVQERRIALIGLGHEISTGTESRIGPRTLQTTTDDEGRILATLGEYRRHEARGCGLAVRSGHGNGRAKSHEFTEHLGARHHRNAALEGARHFGVVARDSRRDDHNICAIDIGGLVTKGDSCAELRQTLRHGVRLEVTALHAIAEIEQHFGNTTHATTTDTDEVDGVDAAHPLCTGGHAAPPPLASARQIAATSSAEDGRARLRARSAICCKPARSLPNLNNSAANRSAVSSRSGSSTAAPRSTRKRALCVW